MTRMFIPGPVDVAPEVLAAQTQPMLPHRSKEFEAIFQRVSNLARQLFFTQQRVFIVTASGTGLQEAVVRNFAHRASRSSANLLSCVNGAFAERWHEVAVANGKSADKLETPWNQPITPELVTNAINQKMAVNNTAYEIITIVHNETSTGVQNPVKEIAAAVQAASPNTLICVDAVSSLGGAKIDMDAWGLDVVLTSSQKCLALPPGLALGAVSEINKFLLQRGMRIANGYGALKDKTFRIAHMGEIQLADVEILLSALDQFLEQV
jgi:aspartate aminotransferase-like enzyme